VDQGPGEEVQLEHVIDASTRLRAPGDGAVMTVAAVGMIAAVAWLAALALISVHLAGHTDPQLGVFLTVVAATLTLVGVHLGLDLSRRRRLVAALDRLGGRIADEHHATDEALGALAREIEQLSAAVLGQRRQTVEHAGGEDVAELTEAQRLQASQVFEMGRRVGQRQAGRTANGSEGASREILTHQ
jgi:hypothetical protein